VLDEAFGQIPAAHRRHVLVRGDSAAATHTVIAWLTNQDKRRGRRVEYSLGWSIGRGERAAITALPTSAWTPAINADGNTRDGAQVAELTGLLTLTGWPTGMRIIVQRERPHPGAQLTLFEEHDGWRYTAFATTTGVGVLQWLKARHRAHAPSKTESAAPKTPAYAGCPPASPPSTRRGAPPPRSPSTCSPGCNCSPWTATSSPRNRNGCATGSCTAQPA
jgi:hypothetical protein